MTQKPGRVWLVRHGATEWSESGKHTGNTDVTLLESGEAAARALAPLLAEQSFALALSSPLIRARRTAELAGLHPEITDDLREWDYGEYEGRTTAEIRQDAPDWTIFSDGAPNGELAGEVAARVDRVIERAREAATSGQDVVCVAHGHVLRVLGVRWVEMAPEDGRHFKLGTAALCILGYEHEHPAIELWNDTSHVPD